VRLRQFELRRNEKEPQEKMQRAQKNSDRSNFEKEIANSPALLEEAAAQCMNCSNEVKGK
jgi:hypothetical protein